jgi:glycine/D-amino acid oxidase-like deaminating enzyme/nitrite reductase/ring-hydroxylating ferredoxin subunit
MKTQSIWEGTAKDGLQFPHCEGSLTADVVIIGGGITGLTAALLLSHAGKDVVLIEAHRIGLGTTGNSTGNLYVTVDEHLSHIKSLWSKEVMQAIVASRGAALKLIEQTISENKIDCDYAQQAFHYYAESLDRQIEKFVEEEFEALSDAGLHPELSDDLGLPFKTVKGIRVAGQAQFHPLKYARGIAQLLSGRCQVFEHSRAIDIDDDRGIVKTEAAAIKADKIIMATHTPVGVYAIHTVLAPYREFGVGLELPSAQLPGGIFWGLNQPKHSIRVYHDHQSGRSYAIAVGDKFKTGQHGDSAEHINGLENYLRARLDVGSTKFTWGGQHYRSADGLAYIGKHGARLYFLTGFATDGLVYGTLAAMIVADEISGRKNPWEETFRADRFTPIKSAKDFVVENADNVLQYLKDVPWNTDAAEVRDVPPGEGKIISLGGEKLGVYKDEAGRAHMVSVVCTHMKCILNWNASEKSWDCPCHGSRFNIDGGVIEGPAIAPLKRR